MYPVGCGLCRVYINSSYDLFHKRNRAVWSRVVTELSLIHHAHTLNTAPCTSQWNPIHLRLSYSHAPSLTLIFDQPRRRTIVLQSVPFVSDLNTVPFYGMAPATGRDIKSACGPTPIPDRSPITKRIVGPVCAAANVGCSGNERLRSP